MMSGNSEKSTYFLSLESVALQFQNNDGQSEYEDTKVKTPNTQHDIIVLVALKVGQVEKW